MKLPLKIKSRSKYYEVTDIEGNCVCAETFGSSKSFTVDEMRLIVKATNENERLKKEIEDLKKVIDIYARGNCKRCKRKYGHCSAKDPGCGQVKEDEMYETEE